MPSTRQIPQWLQNALDNRDDSPEYEANLQYMYAMMVGVAPEDAQHIGRHVASARIFHPPGPHIQEYK